MRSFIALDVRESAVISSIEELQKELSHIPADLKIIEKENIHFTLKFLGEIDESERGEIERRLGSVKAMRFRADFRGMGVFPNERRISVVWVGIDNDSAEVMRRLADRIGESLGGLPFRDDRRFEPHLTIARVRSGRGREALVEFVRKNRVREFGAETFLEFKMKRSELTPRGPIYSDFRSFGLE